MDKQFLQSAIEYLKKEGGKILETRKEGALTPLMATGLESLPRQPHLLIDWEGIELIVFISDKDELFHSKDGKDKTGFDWPTYKFLQHIEAKTGISVVLLIHEKEEDNWFFRQLNQLPPPEQNWRDRCLAKEYQRKDEILNCARCWEKNRFTCQKCMIKIQPMALWDSQEFAKNKSIIQGKLL